MRLRLPGRAESRVTPVESDPGNRGGKQTFEGRNRMNALIINCSPVRDGATAEICGIISRQFSEDFAVRSVCIDDYHFAFCKGCRSCHQTGRCVMHDDAERLMGEFERADTIVCVSPSYWADVPGQFKAFIDRCTPWCNTHEPHAALPSGKRGYAVALRTGPGMQECERIIGTLEHFFGHLEIQCCGRLGLCGVEYRDAAKARREEIEAFCRAMTEGVGE